MLSLCFLKIELTFLFLQVEVGGPLSRRGYQTAEGRMLFYVQLRAQHVIIHGNSDEIAVINNILEETRVKSKKPSPPTSEDATKSANIGQKRTSAPNRSVQPAIKKPRVHTPLPTEREEGEISE
jgi:hypothetical protein